MNLEDFCGYTFLFVQMFSSQREEANLTESQYREKTVKPPFPTYVK